MSAWLRITCYRLLKFRGLRPIVQKRGGGLAYRRDGVSVYLKTWNAAPHQSRKVVAAYVYASSKVPLAERKSRALEEAKYLRKLLPGVPVHHFVASSKPLWKGSFVRQKVQITPL